MLFTKLKCTLVLTLLIVCLQSYKLISNANLKVSKNKREKFCSSKAKGDEILNLSPYKYPINQKGKDHKVTIAILGTNDVHGQAFEKEIKFGQETLKIGGFKLLSAVINKLRSEFSNRFIWLDAGDQFTGTVEKERTDGSLMIDFYNLMKVDSVAIGNHEWERRHAQTMDDSGTRSLL